ncbi:hypothetical protein D3C72_2461740 [compost metagenome]
MAAGHAGDLDFHMASQRGALLAGNDLQALVGDLFRGASAIAVVAHDLALFR